MVVTMTVMAICRCLRMETTGMCQERQGCQNRDHGNVLEQQDGEGILPCRRSKLILFIECLQHDCSRRQRESQTQSQTHLPVQTKGHTRKRHDQRRNANLRAAHTKDWYSEPPQFCRFELQTDKEQHHHHAKFSDVGDRNRIDTQPAQNRRDDDPCDQISQHGTKPKPLRDWYRNHRCGEKKRSEKQE